LIGVVALGLWWAVPHPTLNNIVGLMYQLSTINYQLSTINC